MEKRGSKKGEISILTAVVISIIAISAGVILVNNLPDEIRGITGLSIGVQTEGSGYGFDAGDAPDSTNNYDKGPPKPLGTTWPMTAYPLGGPWDEGTIGYFPTVIGGIYPFGPCHDYPLCVWLGEDVSFETNDADKNYDDDIFLNIYPPDDYSNQDFFDDGLVEPLNLKNCSISNITFEVTCDCYSGEDYFLFNVWFDWNRDGDWDDTFVDACSGQNVSEWAVQNQVIDLSNCTPVSTITLTSDNFLPYNPDIDNMWMRMVLHENDTDGMNSDGSTNRSSCFSEGETEDYYFRACFDIDGDGFNGNSAIDCGTYDCDDDDADVNFQAIEICDGIDNNCNGLVDQTPLDCDLSEIGEGLISYWNMNDLRGSINLDTIYSTCLYSETTERREGIGWANLKGGSNLHGVWQVDFDYWSLCFSPACWDKFDIPPEDNIYHNGGPICYDYHDLLGDTNAYHSSGIPPPITVWGPLPSRQYQPGPDETDYEHLHYLLYGECKNLPEGYYAVSDSHNNYGTHPYTKDCSNPPHGRPQFGISYKKESIASGGVRDIIDGNHGELLEGSPGDENCSWPGCSQKVLLYCPVGGIYPPSTCSCPVPEYPWTVYEYDPWETGDCNVQLANWGACPVKICAPCAPNCVLEGQSLPPYFVTPGYRDIYGSALKFYCDGDYMHANLIGNVPAPNQSQTIALAYKTEDPPDSTFYNLLNLYTSGSSITIEANNQSIKVMKDDNTILVNASLPPLVEDDEILRYSQVGEWIHVVYTYDEASGRHILYLNGREIDNSTVTPNNITPTILRLGTFCGIIDEVAIWNRTLEPYEVTYIYNQNLSYCGTSYLCGDASLIVWDETDRRNLPFATGQGKPAGTPVKSFADYTIIYER